MSRPNPEFPSAAWRCFNALKNPKLPRAPLTIGMGARGSDRGAERLDDRTVRKGKASRYAGAEMTRLRRTQDGHQPVITRTANPRPLRSFVLFGCGLGGSGGNPQEGLGPRAGLADFRFLVWLPTSGGLPFQGEFPTRIGVYTSSTLIGGEGVVCSSLIVEHRPRGPTTRHQSFSAVVCREMWSCMCRTANGSRDQESPP